MKNLTLLFVFVTATICASAQKATPNDFTLLVGGKKIHATDTISRTFIKVLATSPIQIISQDGKKYKPTSYEWVISLKDSNDVYKGTFTSNPPPKNITTGQLTKLLSKAKYGDIFVLDKLVFKPADANLQTVFSFILK